MKQTTVKKDHVSKTRDELQTFCSTLSRGTIPLEVQTRFGLPSRPDSERIIEILRNMERAERHELKRWMNECIAQGKILPLPPQMPGFVPTPAPAREPVRSRYYGFNW